MADQAYIPSSDELIDVARTRWKSIKIDEPGLKLREKLNYALTPLVVGHRQLMGELNQSANLLEDAEKRAAESELELFRLRLKAVDVPQSEMAEAPEVLKGELSAVGPAGQVVLTIETVQNLHLSVTNIADATEEPVNQDNDPRVSTLSDFELAEILYKRLGTKPPQEGTQEGMSMNGNRILGDLNAFHYGPNREHYKH